MSVPQTAQEFLTLCYQEGLLDPQRLQTCFPVRDTLPQDPKELSTVLRDAGLLTSYQAERVLAGEAHRLVLGPYRILRPLGEGGVGLVFLAEQTALKRLVAIKLVRPDREPALLDRERLLREGQAGAALDHPNIVRVIDLCQVGNITFLVMEYVAGIDLQQLRQRDGSFPLAEAVRLIVQVAAALDHIHRRGLLHRDIKPSNLMLTPDGTVKLLDMGLARAEEEVGQGTVAGTLGFLSPEQAMGQKIDARSDVYSLGATLFSLLSGRSLFSSPTEERLAHLGMIPPPPIQRVLEGLVPDRFLAALQRMMAFDANERYSSAEEVIQALQPWLKEPLVIPLQGKPVRLGPRPRSRVWLERLLLVGILLLVLGVAWGLRNASRPEPEAFDKAIDLEPIPTTLAELVYTPDGDKVFGCDWSGKIHVWEVASRGRSLFFADPNHRASYLGMCMDREGKHLAVCGMHCPVRVLEVATGKVVGEFPAQGYRTWGLCFSPEGDRLAVCGEEGLVVRDWITGEIVQRFETPFSYNWSVAFSPDGQYLAAGGLDRDTNQMLILYETKSAKVLRAFLGHTAAVRWLAFHPSQPLLASASFDGWVRLWDYQSGKEIARHRGQEEGYVERVQFLTDSDRLVLCGGPPDARSPDFPGLILWDYRHDRVDSLWQTQETVALTCMRVHPDNRWMVAGGKREGVRLWKIPPPSPK
jgi:serine/threonine protein kinase